MVCVMRRAGTDIRALYTTHEFIINLKDLPLLPPPLSILLTTICMPYTYIYAHNNNNNQRRKEKLHREKKRERISYSF